MLMGLDNPWKGNRRQQVFTLFSKSWLGEFVSHIWVAGAPQYTFARKMGFSDNQILSGLYCADTKPFFEAPKASNVDKKPSLVFLGRYVEYKNPLLLARAFSKVNSENGNPWRLKFIGRGEQGKELQEYQDENISIHEFIQPENLPSELAKHQAFCLPSFMEHWGVVIQEAAAAGLPVLVSDTCGAASAFVINGYNGWVFETNKEDALCESLRKLMKTTFEQREEMGRRSRQLAARINYEIWAAQFLSPLR